MKTITIYLNDFENIEKFNDEIKKIYYRLKNNKNVYKIEEYDRGSRYIFDYWEK